MDIRVIAVGRRMPGWVASAWEEYHRRLPPSIRLELVEVAPEGRQGIAPAKAMAGEAARIQSARRRDALLVALDERGKHFSSRDFARRLQDSSSVGQPLDVMIGGPDGIDPALRAQASESWSLSAMTLPHAMVRVLLVEQIYRGWSIIENHPYHRE